MAAYNPTYRTGAETAAKYSSKIKDSTILITGPSAGSIGGALSVALATQAPKLLLLAGRNITKIQPTLDTINSTGLTRAVFVQLDLADQTSVRSAVAGLDNDVKIDYLINCAAIMALAEFTTTKAADGSAIELQHATNFVGHFLLTNLLLRTHPIRRVVNVSSSAHALSPFLPEQTPQTYHPWTAYGSAKSAVNLFTRELASRGIDTVCVHPGSPQTGLASHFGYGNWGVVMALQEKLEASGEPPVPRGGDDVDADQAGGRVLDACFAGWDKGVYLRSEGGEVVVSEGRPWVRDAEVAERVWNDGERLVGENFEIEVRG